jgi:ligand-binding sensor domain-containing protein/serine phosphatase RsbU (regulator of sigma subunit)
MYKYILSLLILLIHNISFSQIIAFDSYTIKNGLPSNVIMDILQDSEGYMWFATQSGISRFDGFNFKNFSIEDGLPSIYTYCLFEDSKGNIWVGTEDGGVARYNDGEFNVYDAENGLVGNNEIQEIFEDHDENIWVRTRAEGVSKINKNAITNFTQETGLPSNEVLSGFVDSKGRVWFGTLNGIIIFDGKEKRTITTNEGLSDNTVWDIIEDKDNNYWIATQGGGLIKYNGKEFVNYTTEEGLSSGIILKLMEDTYGNIWAGTYENGVCKFNGKSFEVLEYKNLGSNSIRDIYEDSKKRIWIVTYKQGIFQIYKNRFSHYTSENNLLDNKVIKITGDREGNIWLGSFGGILKLSKKPFEIYTVEFGIPDKDILAVHADKSGNVWAGGYNGLFSLDVNNRISVFNVENGLPSNTIRSITSDMDNNIWIGTYYGLTKYSGNKFKTYEDYIWFDKIGLEADKVAYDITEDFMGNIWCVHKAGISKFYNGKYYHYDMKYGIPSNDARAIKIDLINNIWFGTAEGVSVYNGIRFKNITTEQGLSNNSCNDIAVDSSGSIWIGTDNGLNKITRKNGDFEIKVYTIKDGLISNSIMFVETDRANNLWIGYDKGLNKINLDNFKIQYYSELEGFTPLETYLRAVTVDLNNNVWVGTGNGLVRYIPDLDDVRKNPPVTYITDFFVYGDTTDLLNYAEGIDSISGLPLNLRLPYNKNNLIFEYIGLHFSIPEKNRYQYMLEGYDESWSEVTDKTQTDQYKKLPHGNYTFKVKAANCDGIWTPEPVSFSFSITPPFWRTKWFLALEIIFAIALIFIFIKARERKLQHDKKVLAQKVKERTIEIEKQRDKIAEQNREITDSIMYAQRIQSAVLPDMEYTRSILPQHFIFFKPRDIVSGDFYWMTETSKDIIVAVADCTGHGVPGAFMSMLGVSLLNEIINVNREHTANEILESLRKNVKQTLSQRGKKDETRDGMDIALCIINFKERKVQFSGAYNSLLLVRNSDQILFKGDKMPIGIHVGKEKPFTNHNLKISRGDMLYLYTDGYADQFGGPEEKKFKSVTFRQLLLDIHNKPLEEQSQILDKTLEDWRGNLSQIDDILVMGLRV